MKNILLCLSAMLAVACMSSCAGNAEDVEVGPYTVSVIEKNVYHIQDCNSSYPAGMVTDEDGKYVNFNNCSDMYLVVGKNKALLIDLSNNIKWADNAAESLRQLVAERSEGKELIVTFTHNHGDHIGMLHAYIEDPEVKFALPENDFGMLMERFPADQCEFIKEGYVFDLGGKSVEVIDVPGHTNGSVAFYIQGRNIMFTGDAIGSGQGVWIFNEAGYRQYATAVPHLVEWVEDPMNGVDTEKLLIFGGHYWQKIGTPELHDAEMGMTYLLDMKNLIDDIAAGTVATEPANLGRPGLDTYFRHGTATIVWNAEQAKAFAENL